MATIESVNAKVDTFIADFALFLSKSKTILELDLSSSFNGDSYMPVQKAGESAKRIKATLLSPSMLIKSWDGYVLIKATGNTENSPETDDTILGRGIGTFFGGEDIYGSVISGIPTGHGSDSDINLYTSYP